MTDIAVPGAEALRGLAQELTELLRLKTLPIGMKLYEDVAALDAIPGLRRPKKGAEFSTCQLVTQARVAGLSLGIVHDNLRGFSNCGGIIGLNEPGEDHLSGQRMTGVWFENQEAARAHQDHMPRVPHGRYHALVVAPLRAARLDPPDIALFYATPGAMIYFINGLQWSGYKRFDWSVVGESARADSWGRALKTREPSLSIPCFAERRYGGVLDDEMLMALPPDDIVKAIAGMEALAKNGLRYPFPQYGIQQDVHAGMAVSYPGRSS
jgi:uncharacterized protein (DUF169 family)